MTSDLITRIDGVIQDRSLLKHPFYQAWTEGTLPKESLKEYAGQYYHFEAAYPTFLSGLHYRCTDQRIRQLLLDNLWDEEHGSENHVELWLRFCDALDLDREQVKIGEPMAATAALVSTYKDLTSRSSLASGAAALYAYETQVPEIATAKLEGLRRFYGIGKSEAVSFFEVHRTLDEEHSAAESEMVLALAPMEGDKLAVLDAVDRATDGLWQFLDEVYG